ncbi:universal stress protein UspE [Idiomarina xiamenensis]|uniref:Universal stress protein UspE n=1 Tax=Idiomarina xiamenensis 10-D-4 TaxID=740709 RepID=K2JU77_9GAMM|nr:universal stress protein UspE [Idiomarina xiamenensis 10-D-4]
MDSTQASEQRILVVLDATEQQQKALHRALELARLTSAKQLANVKLTLFLSIYDFSYEMTTMLAAQEREAMRHSLIADREAWIKDLLSDYDMHGVEHELCVMWHNRPYEAIVIHAIEQQHDLIIKSTRRHDGLQHVIFTPTDWHILRKAPCPVLLVKDHDWPQQGHIIAAIHALSDNDHHDSLNRRIIERALALAEPLQAQVHLLNAYPGAPMNIAVEIPEFDMVGYGDTLAKQHLLQLQHYADRYHIPAACCHVEEGMPEHVIPEVAERLDAELVVLGTVGRSGFSAALIGNTAEHVIDHLNCDVLAVKPEGFKSPLAKS